MFKVLLTLLVGMFLSVDAFAQQITVKGLLYVGTGEAPVANPKTEFGFSLTCSIIKLATALPISSALLKI